MRHTHYDYILAGGGGSGLSLLNHLLDSPTLSQKRILVVERAEKRANTQDRTWCFWERPDADYLKSLPTAYSWSQVESLWRDKNFKREISPYQYYYLRSGDFYESVKKKARSFAGITFLQADIHQIIPDNNYPQVETSGGTFSADYIFSSLWDIRESKREARHWLSQKFLGWFVHSETPIFDPETVRLMDFRADQSQFTQFFYVLPFSQTSALIESTAFVPKGVSKPDFEGQLKDYLKESYGIENPKITLQEAGNIPMTDFDFAKKHSQSRVIPIGTAGGATKASTGYTFKNIQLHSQQIINRLERGKTPKAFHQKSRFAFYDTILLDLLKRPEAEAAEQIFGRLLHRPDRLFRFLDEKTTILQEFQLFLQLSWPPFLRAAYRQLRPRQSLTYVHSQKTVLSSS
ncbi:MAG: lycopene cyclase family protein [Bacteroidota bacterium]